MNDIWKRLDYLYGVKKHYRLNWKDLNDLLDRIELGKIIGIDNFHEEISVGECCVCHHPFLKIKHSRQYICKHCEFDRKSGKILYYSDLGFKVSADQIEDIDNMGYDNPVDNIKAYKKEMSKKIRGELTHNMKKMILLAYQGKCAICGYKLEGFNQNGNAIHHITPVCEGGKSSFDNLTLLCPNHHHEAHLNIITRDVLHAIAREKISQCADFLFNQEGFK